MAYTLMVAGRRTGKTAFLRLLLDTSPISPDATRDQLASVARFVHASPARTTHISSTSVDIEPPSPDHPSPLRLTLVDTPTLDFDDDPAPPATLNDIMRFLDARFSDSVDNDRNGDHHVHLCIYFLDPDQIVPLAPRAPTNSLSDADPVILDPPAPLLTRPSLPQSDITSIRRLSQRVNVLPVLARADTLTNDRLAVVKSVIKQDLAKAGIGFGIFDNDPHSLLDLAGDPVAVSSPSNPNAVGGASPVVPLLPFALISPDIYSHSDGVVRPVLSSHDLVYHYDPSSSAYQYDSTGANLTLAKTRHTRKYVRTYRWGALDVLDEAHCDFVPLRKAIFYHMEVMSLFPFFSGRARN
ncbi:hypothetical protein K474DRAFT_1663200 [Panus rudis PR-1116 ss-1]|nr:hypothetical protein K474DRAFT_1663200 [Panus rudis PR-1116 ss-1]